MNLNELVILGFNIKLLFSTLYRHVNVAQAMKIMQGYKSSK